MATRKKEKTVRTELNTKLKVGDTVMVIAGGSPKKPLKGQTGKILRFMTRSERVVVEGLNIVKRHKRQNSAQEAGGIITKEGSIALSNVMFYSETLKRPVRIKSKVLEDGRRVRGFVNPTNKKFEQIDA